MGWAARGLGLKIDDALDDFKRTGDSQPVRDALHHAYGDETFNEAFGNMIDVDMIESAEAVRKGVPIATPVCYLTAAQASSLPALLRSASSTC